MRFWNFACLIAPAIVAGLLAGCSASTGPTASFDASAARPNIILIIADDQAPRTLGLEGNQLIRTPSLDRMAREGVYFSRMYVPLAQCAPSRAALLTGRYPHALGTLSNNQMQLPKDAITIAQLLKRAGYRCGMVGKWHQGNPLTPQAGFDDFWVGRDKNAKPKEQKYYDPVIVANGRRREHKGFLTDVLTDYALDFIKKPADKPFFLWLSYYAPHEPFMPHPDHPYDPAVVPYPNVAADDLSTKPPQQSRSICHVAFGRYGEARIRKQIADYYSMISAMDADIGRILDQLRKSGRDKNTLVIFLSDNGWLNGEHQLLLKGPMLYEELVRMPMIVWQPGVVPKGAVRDGLVSSLDVFSTIVRRSGAAIPLGVDSRDLWAMIASDKPSTRSAVYLEFLEKGSTHDREPMLGVVTQRFKYNRYLAGGDEELYDLSADPFEYRNLIGSGEHAAELKRQRALLDAFAKSIKPPFWSKGRP